MFFKRILPIIIILLAVIVGFRRFQNPCGETIDLTYQNGWQGSFQVKIERKPETCGFAPALAGANYIFSSREENSENWQEIMTIYHDDPVEISKKSIQILNERTAAVFMNQKFAVTTDKGQTWTAWDIDKDLGLEKHTKFRSISHINFDEDGFAVMVIDAVSNNGRKYGSSFMSHNFGKTWEAMSK
jgi:hypothetical protein